MREPISPDVRISVLLRDRNRCVVCGSDERLEVDHVDAVFRGGSSRMENLQTLCKSCNAAKQATDWNTWVSGSGWKIKAYVGQDGRVRRAECPVSGLVDEFEARVRALSAQRGLALTTLSVRFFNDSKTLPGLLNGTRSPTLDSMARAFDTLRKLESEAA